MTCHDRRRVESAPLFAKRAQVRGQATVELALVLPILLLLLLGIAQFGLIFQAQLVIDSAARDGARLGAIGGDDTAIRDRVAATSGFDPSTLQITITPQGPPGGPPRAPGSDVMVNVTHPVRIIVPMFESLLGGSGGTFTVSATSRMRVE